MTDHRAALASARRLYLHWTQAQQPGNPTQLTDDIGRIVASFEAAVDEIDRSADLRKRVEELEAALKPFADMAGHYDKHYGNRPRDDGDTIMQLMTHDVGEHEITVGDLRAARKALEAAK